MRLETPPAPPRANWPHPVVWWVLWFAILNGLMMIYYFFGRKETDPTTPARALD